jgi:hypothetical protein
MPSPSRGRLGWGPGASAAAPPHSPSCRRVSSVAIIFALGVALAILPGCQRIVAVPIRVKVASSLDLGEHTTFAVIPFVDRDSKLPPERLYELTQMLHRGLNQMRGVTVVSQSAVYDLMETEDLSVDGFEDVDNVMAWGEMLGATAVVTGVVRYYTVLESRQRPVERYSYQLQRYVSDVTTELARAHYMRLHLRIHDARDGTILVERTLRRNYHEPQSVFSMMVSEIAGSSDIVVRLAQSRIRRFVRGIAPHYELEERYLAR